MEFVTIESRPRIRACYIYVYLTESTESHFVQVILDRNSIKIKIAENLFVIDLPSINIVTSSLCNLNVSGKWIVFRVHTTPTNLSNGTFFTEVIEHSNALKNNCSENTEVVKLPKKDTLLSLICSSCNALISKRYIKFQRVMQLPNSDFDPSEWFCCSDNCAFDHETILSPKLKDFFYSSHFCIMNKNIFSPNIKIRQTDVLCQCETVLGTVADNYSLQIWNYAFKYEIVAELTTPLMDFKLVLRSYAFVNDILMFAVEKNVYYYLRIKVLDKNLSLFVESNSTQTGNVKMTEKKAFKVLYHCPNVKTPDLKEEVNAHVCQVGLRCLNAGLEYLIKTTKRIPPSYNKINDDNVGFII